MLWTMANYDAGPIAIRYPRGAGTGAKPKAQPKLLEIGKAEVVQHGEAMSPSSASATCSRWPRKPRRNWKRKGISVALINPRWIKPLDTGTLEFFARGVQVICTIEDHVLHNGFGCAVMEHLHTPDDQHTGRADRLARSIHRARQYSCPAQEARPNERRASRKSVAAFEKTSGKGALDCGVTQASTCGRAGFQPGECWQDARLTRQPGWLCYDSAWQSSKRAA